jgi:hypothetical protein
VSLARRFSACRHLRFDSIVQRLLDLILTNLLDVVNDHQLHARLRVRSSGDISLHGRLSVGNGNFVAARLALTKVAFRLVADVRRRTCERLLPRKAEVREARDVFASLAHSTIFA